VSPIGVASFLSRRGLMVLSSELRWVWAPATAVSFMGVLFRKALKVA
jgi:hypothetical protein